MISNIFFTTLYQPIYNSLVFLVSFMPFYDIGLAVVLLTLVVKFILFPLAHKTTKTQASIKVFEPEVQRLKEEYKEDKQEQSRKIMELYKKHGVNPFSGCLLFLVQFPIIIALYWVFWKGLENGINTEQLYSFVIAPAKISTDFLGLIDISGRSFFLAALAGISQYFQIKLSMPSTLPKKEGAPASFKEDFKRSFQLQMRYGLPVFVFFIAYTISAVIALYWLTSNLFSIVHELFVKRKVTQLLSNKEEGVV
ncbi:MAG: YidC/Oxa1 family membrane protein insertase [Candidatus Paceibacterota bacterium]